MYHVERTTEEVEALLDTCKELLNNDEESSGFKSRYPDWAYEQVRLEGILEGILWLIGDTDEHPFDD